MEVSLDTQQEVAGVRWYHTIELPDGTVTPGQFDTRDDLRRMPFPDSLEGKRCLDVGTWDGFWAFEMERRGAAEVVAIDLLEDPTRWDWPESAPPSRIEALRGRKGGNAGFRVAQRALGSQVQHRDLSVYELTPELVGSYDFVFVGSLLLHLQDPVRALMAVRGVLDGELLCADQISLSMSLLRPRHPAADLHALEEPRWWTPNLAALRRWVHAAGFEVLDSGGPFFTSFGAGFRRYARPGRGPAVALSRAFQRRMGVPHGWVRASSGPPRR